MMPRFRTDIEKEYTQLLNDDISNYYQVCNTSDYEALLRTAIQRKSAVTQEELIALVGEDIFKKHTEYLSEEGVL